MKQAVAVAERPSVAGSVIQYWLCLPTGRFRTDEHIYELEGDNYWVKGYLKDLAIAKVLRGQRENLRIARVRVNNYDPSQGMVRKEDIDLEGWEADLPKKEETPESATAP